jgi:hypothetical protein
MIDDVTSTVIIDLQAAYRFNTHDVKLKAGLLEVLKYYMTAHDYAQYLLDIKHPDAIYKTKAN